MATVSVKKTRVTGDLLKTLKNTSWTTNLFQGFLFGQKNVEGSFIVGVAKTNQFPNDEIDQTYDYVEKYLAGGLEICGIVIYSESDQPQQKTWKNVDLMLSDSFILEKQLLVCVTSGIDTIEINNSFYWLPNDTHTVEPEKADITVGDFDVLSQSILSRFKTKISLNVLASNQTDNCFNLHRTIEELCLDINYGGSFTFCIDNTSVLLTSDDVIGLTKNTTASSLLEDLNASKAQKSGQQETLSISLLQRLSCNNNVPTCAPFIHHSIGEEKCFMVDLPIDVLCLIPYDLPIKDIYKLLCMNISRQVETMKTNLDDNKKDERYFLPEVFHFQPVGTGYYLSVIYPKDVSDDSLESTRKELHEVFALPMDKPILRRCNRCIFGGESIPGGYILNPHTAININPLKDSKFFLVQGNYSYHHYMQDNFDDNKWGCAYRSLQTLVSWFRFQGYTDKPVPSHKEIQQALVDIGDKDTKFVGSRQWIGSLEVSYCLENLIEITCKIMSVSAGAELANKGRELSQHFSSQGTPVMIGGGVLAHTILGVNFSEVTGDLKFLILDPHYTGDDNIREIIDKGWCGWKGPDFWNQTAMYNLCMPQRPHVI